MRRGNLEPCRNHRPGGRRRRSGAGLDDVRAVSADRVAVTIGTAGRVVPISGRRLHLNHGCLIRACVRKRGRRFSGCPEPAGTLIGRQIESWDCHSRHRHREPAGSITSGTFSISARPRGQGRGTARTAGLYTTVRRCTPGTGTRPPARPALPSNGTKLVAGDYRSRHPRRIPLCAV